MSVKYLRGVNTQGLVLAYDFANPRCVSEFRTPNLATGGNSITERVIDGEVYVQHVFTTAGTIATFTPNQFMEVEYLVVGGGGGGGGVIGGGGGGGGVLYGKKYVFGPQDVYVGRGGRGGVGWNSLTQAGDPGQNSYFGEKIGYGGGGGGWAGGASTSWYGATLTWRPNGGSGGGSYGGGAPGTGVAGQGYAGGTGSDGNRGSGGGGAGAVGGTPPSTGGGNGGAGANYSTIFGTGVGVSGVFGGGGGGGSRGATAGITTSGSGGSGGGGAGTLGNVVAANGTANTGGGGGGAGHVSEIYTPMGGNGGSGVVIVRYKKYPSLHDLSGNSLDAAPRNNVAYSTLGGGSLLFDGVDDRLVIPGTATLSLNTMTISLWVYTSNYAQAACFFEKTTNGAVNTQYSLLTASSNLYFRTYGLSTVDYILSMATLGISNSNWYNITVTFDGSAKRMYVNGVLKGTQTGLTGTVTQNTTGVSYIGSHGTTYSYHFSGNIAAEHIYNRALSDTEVLSNFNALKSRFGL